jgi:hypothetical protein
MNKIKYIFFSQDRVFSSPLQFQRFQPQLDAPRMLPHNPYLSQQQQQQLSMQAAQFGQYQQQIGYPDGYSPTYMYPQAGQQYYYQGAAGQSDASFASPSRLGYIGPMSPVSSPGDLPKEYN